MNDYPRYSAAEQIRCITPLDRLDQELSAVRGVKSMDVVIGKYIADEMSVTQVEANYALDFMKQQGIFTTQLEDSQDGENVGLEDEYRIGIFTGIMPLYQALHTTAEYAQWLPSAIDVVLPISGNHGIHANCHEVKGADSCWTQNICPLKVIIAVTKESVSFPDFDSPVYIAKPEDARNQVAVLLSVLEDKGLLLKTQRSQLLNEYIGKYNDAFSVPG